MHSSPGSKCGCGGDKMVTPDHGRPQDTLLCARARNPTRILQWANGWSPCGVRDVSWENRLGNLTVFLPTFTAIRVLLKPSFQNVWTGQSICSLCSFGVFSNWGGKLGVLGVSVKDLFHPWINGSERSHVKALCHFPRGGECRGTPLSVAAAFTPYSYSSIKLPFLFPSLTDLNVVSSISF